MPGWADDLADGGQPFTPPLAAHMLCYLQDMDGPGGPLLAVSGSHRSAFGDKPAGPEEVVVPVDAKAGDVVFFHCDMLHSGSANRRLRLALHGHLLRRARRPAPPRRLHCPAACPGIGGGGARRPARCRRGGTAAVAPRALTRDRENQGETQLSLSL